MSGQLILDLNDRATPMPKPEPVRFEFRRRRNARRYTLRLNGEGVACVTIPRGGNLTEARAFVGRNTRWLENQLAKHRAQQTAALPGNGLLFHGAVLPLAEVPGGALTLGDFKIPLLRGESDTRLRIKSALWRLASMELPTRVLELALKFSLEVRRVSVRDQRSRWGSCSSRKVISLNWRLVQAPDFVRDYIIIHELMHLREMNHSSRYWKLVAEACPYFEEAESWLKKNSALLRQF